MKELLDKYNLLNESLKAISQNAINLLILRGEAGFGKTHATLEFVSKQGINYKYVNNYATPLSFYHLLYKNRKKEVIIFDDIQGISDPKIRSILKSACWESEEGKRIINYNSTSSILDKHEIPTSFELEARIILIFNEHLEDFDPVFNRGVLINLDFSFEEKVKILEDFQEVAGIDKEVLDYVKSNCNPGTQNLSIRTLVILSKLKSSDFDFRMFAKEMLKTDDETFDLINLDYKSWFDKTGQHYSTYYRKRKRLGLK